MKFTTTQQELNKALAFVSKAVTVRSTMPVLKGILLSADDNGMLTMTASDMDLSIEKKMPVNVSEPGSTVLPARLFGDIIRKLPQENIEISLEDYRNVSIRTSLSEFKIVGMPADEFPDIGTVEENRKISLNREIFKDMIRKTSFAASIDESKGVIVGVLIEMKDGKVNMAALDGFRMAVATEETSSAPSDDIIISARILNEINKILSDSDDDENENVELILDDKKAVILTEDSRIILRMIEGKFLKYRDLIPAEFKTVVHADRNLLISSIERASLLAKEGRNNLIRLSFADDSLHIMSKSEAGNVNENIPVKIDGENIEIGFNSKYLIDGLKVMKEDDIIICLNTNISPCIIRPAESENFTYLILPVRIMS